MTIDLSHLIRRAQQMRRLHDGHLLQDWYTGYIQGLNRAMHGASFGSASEHATWSTLHTSRDPHRQLMGMGYLAGLQGQWSEPPEQALVADRIDAAMA